MKKLTQAFLDSCPRDKGYIMRGEAMTRIETFVDAAFAFAFTMLIISVDEIPKSVSELFNTSRDIPAFLVSCAQIGAIWYAHSIFSRRYGLQDGRTVILSLCLVMLVLIFIYPLKLVFMGFFSWISGGYLSSGLSSMSQGQLADLFVYFALGLLSYAIISFLMLKNVLKQADIIRLTSYERYACQTEVYYWLIYVFISLISILLAKTLNGMWVTLSGFIYFVIFIPAKILEKIRDKNKPAIE